MNKIVNSVCLGNGKNLPSQFFFRKIIKSNSFNGKFKFSTLSDLELQKNSKEIQDVLIVGGGPAGLTLATALRSLPGTSKLKISLVEFSDLKKVKEFDPPFDFYENRVSSLTPSTKKFLEKIGAWNYILQERVEGYDEMRVWDGISGARLNFNIDSSPFEGEPIAYMCENRNLQYGLFKKMSEYTENPVNIYDKTKVVSIKRRNLNDGKNLLGWPIVELDNGKKILSRLIVGADGANSPVRKFGNIQSRGWDYNTHGLVATIKLEYEDFSSVAYQRFLPTGPIAMLPLPNGFASLVWSTRPHIAKHLKSLSEQAFVNMVNAAFTLDTIDLEYLYKISDETEIKNEFEWRRTIVDEKRIEKGENILEEGVDVPIRVKKVLENSRASFPLRFRHADTYVKDRLALVGDAAHSMHPLAGQGLNSGQRDVEALVNTLEKGIKQGQDIGSILTLDNYWADRYLDNHVLLGVVDKLHKLYSFENYPTVLLRSWGLEAVNELDFVKKMVIKAGSTPLKFFS